MDLDRLKRCLFDKVRLGQTDNILSFLRQVDVNSTNEKDETPLIVAAKNRNYVIQKLLVKEGAKINKRDQEGRSALHYESGYGDVQSINLLLANGAHLNQKDHNGRTSLHFAVSGGHVAAVDILVFCGADSTIKDENGVTPEKLNRHPAITGLMKDSIRTVLGIKYGYIKIDRGVLRSGESKYFPNLDSTITTPSTFASADVYMLSRRARPEFTYNTLENKELLMSDTFEFRLSGADVLDYADMELPLFSNAEYYEEVHIKTNVKSVQSGDNKDVFDIKLTDNELRPVTCCVKVDFSVVDSLYMVTRPILERFQIPENEGTTFTSEVDSNVTLRVEDGTFISGGCLLLEILMSPNNVKDQEDFQHLLSYTYFHDVKHSKSEQPRKITELTLPVPADFILSSNVFTYVLVRSDEFGDGYNPSSWSIIDRNPKIENQKIYVRLGHFCPVQCVQYSIQAEPMIIEETEKRYQKVLRAESQATFLALVKNLKPDDKDEIKAEVIIECTSDPVYKRRIEYWESRGYADQNPSYSRTDITYSGQTFTLDIKGGLKKKTSAEIQLEFHPKRKKNNLREILIEPSVKDSKNTNFHGELEIHRLDEDKKKWKFQSKKGTRHLELLDFIKIHINNHDESEPSIKFSGFTSDRLMKEIHDRLNDEERRKVLVDLHIDYNSQNDDTKQSFLKWGHMVLKRVDLGLTDLISVLTKINQKQAAKVLQDLKKWKAANKKIKTPFTAWLNDLDPDDNIDIKKLRKPLSDDYFKNLAHILVTNGNKISPLDLFTQLSLSEEAIKKVTENLLFRKPIIQFYTLLKKFRLTYDSEIQCLEKLQDVLRLDKLEIKGAANWADNMAKDWINSKSANTKDEFYQRLKEYLSPGQHTERGSLSLQESSNDDTTDKVNKPSLEKRRLTNTTIAQSDLDSDLENSHPTENQQNGHQEAAPTMNEHTEQQQPTPTKNEHTQQQQATPTKNEHTEQQQATPTKNKHTEQQQATSTKNEHIEQQQATPTKNEHTEQQQAIPTKNEQTEQQEAPLNKNEHTEHQAAASTRNEKNEQQEEASTKNELTKQQDASPTKKEQTEQQEAGPIENELIDQQATVPTLSGVHGIDRNVIDIHVPAASDQATDTDVNNSNPIVNQQPEQEEEAPILPPEYQELQKVRQLNKPPVVRPDSPGSKSGSSTDSKILHSELNIMK